MQIFIIPIILSSLWAEIYGFDIIFQLQNLIYKCFPIYINIVFTELEMPKFRLISFRFHDNMFLFVLDSFCSNIFGGNIVILILIFVYSICFQLHFLPYNGSLSMLLRIIIIFGIVITSI